MQEFLLRLYIFSYLIFFCSLSNNFIKSSELFSQVNPLDHLILPFSIFLRIFLFFINKFTFWANFLESPQGTKSPLWGFLTESHRPGTFDATTGVPQAFASIAVIPQPSIFEGCTITQDFAKSSALTRSLTFPAKLTTFCKLSL